MILRKEIKHGYTTIPQNITRDENLSLKELGLLVKLLSMPDNWNFSFRGLEKILKKDGEASLRTGLNSLEEHGYLCRGRSRNDKGQLQDTEWVVTDDPKLENPVLDNQVLDNQAQLIPKVTNYEKKSSCAKRSLPRVDEDSNEYKLANFILESVKANFHNVRVKDNHLTRWALDIEKIHSIDGYDWQTICDVLEFALNDHFWKQNIRSGEKFREKFDDLLIRKDSYDQRNT